MDRAMLAQHLTQAEKHIILGEELIARQRELVAGLEQNDHDPTEAKRLLATFEQVQATHMAGRDRLRRQVERGLGSEPLSDSDDRLNPGASKIL
jgi:hypothetical protein